MRKSTIPLTKHSIRLFENDMEELMAIAGTKLGASRVIRELLRAYLASHRAKFAAQAKPMEIDIE